jgi:Uri superfamily endonuclease
MNPYRINKVKPRGGSYALLLRLQQPVRIAVGRLGEFDFPAGDYVYTGSAFGPGGLEARLKRHFLVSKKNHWHIDYLRAQAELVGSMLGPDQDLECTWAKELLKHKGYALVSGFGASDCRQGCPAHLVYFENPCSIEDLKAILQPEPGATF